MLMNYSKATDNVLLMDTNTDTSMRGTGGTEVHLVTASFRNEPTSQLW